MILTKDFLHSHHIESHMADDGPGGPLAVIAAVVFFLLLARRKDTKPTLHGENPSGEDGITAQKNISLGTRTSTGPMIKNILMTYPF